jgi:hypothetical protein
MMDKVRKPSNPECYAQLSEPLIYPCVSAIHNLFNSHREEVGAQHLHPLAHLSFYHTITPEMFSSAVAPSPGTKGECPVHPKCRQQQLPHTLLEMCIHNSAQTFHLAISIFVSLK